MGGSSKYMMRDSNDRLFGMTARKCYGIENLLDVYFNMKTFEPVWMISPESLLLNSSCAPLCINPPEVHPTVYKTRSRFNHPNTYSPCPHEPPVTFSQDIHSNTNVDKNISSASTETWTDAAEETSVYEGRRPIIKSKIAESQEVFLDCIVQNCSDDPHSATTSTSNQIASTNINFHPLTLEINSSSEREKRSSPIITITNELDNISLNGSSGPENRSSSISSSNVIVTEKIVQNNYSDDKNKQNFTKKDKRIKSPKNFNEQQPFSDNQQKFNLNKANMDRGTTKKKRGQPNSASRITDQIKPSRHSPISSGSEDKISGRTRSSSNHSHPQTPRFWQAVDDDPPVDFQGLMKMEEINNSKKVEVITVSSKVTSTHKQPRTWDVQNTAEVPSLDSIMNEQSRQSPSISITSFKGNNNHNNHVPSASNAKKTNRKTAPKKDNIWDLAVEKAKKNQQ